MVKQKYRILVFLYLLIAGQLNAQQFNFESDKKQNTQFNQKIEEALNNNDLKLMKKILDKEPSLVNSSSKMTSISGYSKLSGGKIPLLYDAVGYNPIKNILEKGLDKQQEEPNLFAKTPIAHENIRGAEYYN
jgi:hypothetical protein